MADQGGAGTRRAFIVVGILLAAGLLATIFWVRRAPGSLPLDKLLEDLRSDEPSQRAVAAEGLAKLRDPRAVDPLIAAMKDKQWTVRRSAAAALGKLRDGRAVPALIEALNDETVWVKIAAAKALGELCDPSALAPLEKLLKQEKAKPKQRQNSDLTTFSEEAIKAIQSK